MAKTKKHASLTEKKRNQERMKNQELVLKEEMQTYGMVIRALGDRRFEVQCSDGVLRQCKIRGKFRGRLFIVQHDILLISLREDEPGKADIIQKYRPEEIHELKKLGEFTDRDFAIDGETDVQTGNDGLVIWTNDAIDNV